MSLPIVCVVVGILAFAFGYVAKRTLNSYDHDALGFLSVIACGACCVFVLIVPSIVYGSRAVGRHNCSSFAQQTGRQTKFVLYNSWATGECLTKTADGRWIPVSNLREFGTQP